MIPLRLRLRNFLCYGEETQSLDLSAVHLACLAGDNGHGKSALLDAITWALWGKARVQHDDELIHQGKSEMEVELEFRLSDVNYRVIRKRDSKRGHSSLEFQVRDNGRFQPLTEATIRQTQARILHLLRMDYETFINSAFLVQGRADEFTIKPPAERKRILGDILGLSQYDAFQERAKEKYRQKEVELSELTTSLAGIEKELSRKSEYQEVLLSKEIEAKGVLEEVQKQEQNLRSLYDQDRERKQKQAQREDLRGRIEKATQELKEIQSEMDRGQRRVEVFEHLLAEETQIREGFAALIAAREANEEFNRRLGHVVKLNERKNDLERCIAQAKSEIELERRGVLERLTQAEQLAKRRTALEANLASARTQVQKSAGLEEDLKATRAEDQAAAEKIASLQALNQTLKGEMQTLKEKVELLRSAKARCPLCDSELSGAKIADIQDNYQREGHEKGDLYRANQAAVAELKTARTQIQQSIASLEEALKKRAALSGQEAALTQTLQEVAEAERGIGLQKEGLIAIEGRLEKGDYAKEERKALAELQNRLRDLAYEAKEHELVRERLSSLSDYENQMKELERATDGLQAEKESLERLTVSHHRWQEMLEADQVTVRALKQHIQALSGLDQTIQETETKLRALQDHEKRVRESLGEAQGRLSHCNELQAEKEKQLISEARAREEAAIFQELEQAFGKRGIQAMIIERVLPELEEEANRLLGRMTDGRMHIRFETQKLTKKGQAQETLEIKIGDELGERAYELYSGGEAFRVNFATRVALSKLLARRAGTKLETLVIDEGFGTQDNAGRERLIEAINSIQADFARILVITHIDELKDAFPVRIDIFKTPRGSQIAMT